ncbi:uncharacterized protein LOC133452139 [Cololabis saira]|uniref:uncharacterized protein LOC133452139 n=1 Tax=Cololabis saira TaxID=129043 RepID=UPI002AD35637|nr:uncharacterized protein LOC133452139 [Cololabis saira]
MCFPGWTITLVLFCLCGSANSFPYTSAHSLPSQITPPSPLPTNLPFEHSPFLSTPSSTPPFTSSSGETTNGDNCHLKMSPSVLVVRFGDPVKANCSKEGAASPLLGWEGTQGSSGPTSAAFLVWSLDRITEWSMKPSCYELLDLGGSCSIELPLIVYQPPDRVSIQFLNHTGALFEGHRYTLQCTVHDVAPVENVIVTFYKDQTALGQLQSCNKSQTPVNESFTLSITPCKPDNGSRYWCEAKLELGPEGPLHPPVVMSQKLTALVLSSPQLVQSKLQVKNTSKCDMKTNPQAFGGSGTSNRFKGWFLLAALLCQIVIQL